MFTLVMGIREHLLKHVTARSLTSKNEWADELRAFDRDVVMVAHASKRREVRREAINTGEILEQLLGWLTYGDPILDQGYEIDGIAAHIRASIATSTKG